MTNGMSSDNNTEISACCCWSHVLKKEGLVKVIKKLQEYGLEINTLVTDQHRQIAKWMKIVPNITYYFDIWHLAKGTININSGIAISFIILGFPKSYWHWQKRIIVN